MKQTAQEEQVTIKARQVSLDGTLELPDNPIGIVLFAHGSGSSRLSPRNNFVAGELRRASMGTLLIDLLTQHEDKIYKTRFDIALLSERLDAVIAWLGQHECTRGIPIGLFGASTGSAAALQAAARNIGVIAAVVSRGGRPDMAGRHALEQVRAPTLLIVGGHDDVVIELNRAAYSVLRCEKQLELARIFRQSSNRETEVRWKRPNCSVRSLFDVDSGAQHNLGRNSPYPRCFMACREQHLAQTKEPARARR